MQLRSLPTHTRRRLRFTTESHAEERERSQRTHTRSFLQSRANLEVNNLASLLQTYLCDCIPYLSCSLGGDNMSKKKKHPCGAKDLGIYTFVPSIQLIDPPAHAWLRGSSYYQLAVFCRISHHLPTSESRHDITKGAQNTGVSLSC